MSIDLMGVGAAAVSSSNKTNLLHLSSAPLFSPHPAFPPFVPNITSAKFSNHMSLHSVVIPAAHNLLNCRA